MTMGEEEDSLSQPVDYIDEMTLNDSPQQKMLFASSGTVLTIDDKKMPPVGIAVGIFIIFISLLGFLNGLDYASAQSGLVRPDEFIYSMSRSAPDDSATFRGTIYDDNGQELNGTVVYVSWLEDNMWNSSEAVTDETGKFELEELDPGMVRVDIYLSRNGHTDLFSNRVLLSPPALFEPIGFTTIDFSMPSEEEFASQKCTNGAEECEIREIDRTPQQMDHPLMDPGAATLYTTVGVAFIGLSIISGSLTIWALKSGSVGLLRTSAALSFFTMGHYYSACIFGLVAFVLTYSIKKPQRHLN